MKKIISYSATAIVLIGIIAVIAVKLINNKKTAESRVYHARSEEAYQKPENKAKVQEDIVETLDLKSYTGTFESFKESKISAEMQGKIVHFPADAGNVVSKGQALVQLDNELLKLQLKAVEVQIEGLQNDVKRYEILAKAEAVQAIQAEKSELALKSAQIQRETLQEQIKKTTVLAPFSGVVAAKLSEEGSFAAPGVPLLLLTDISKLKFTILVSENDLMKFSEGKNYDIIADIFPEEKLNGVLIHIGSKANPANQFTVQFLVQNIHNQAVKSGMFGKITF
jgi:RND family efflux transporter MFP subunit